MSKFNIYLQPLPEDVKRELRLDSKRYKENKAKLRRQRDQMQKNKNNQSNQPDVLPSRRIRKLTDGIPNIAKIEDTEVDEERTFIPITSRLNSLDVRKPKVPTFNTPPLSNRLINHAKQSTSTAPEATASTSLTHLLVSKLPSIGHKFVSDAKELIMKNAIKPVATTSFSPITPTATKPVVAGIKIKHVDTEKS